MSFGNIGPLFDRFKNLQLPDETLRRLASEIITRECGVTIPIEKISIQNGVLSVDANPRVRSEVFMRRDAILDQLRAVCKERTLKDIR
jgi:hypothetical protein